MSEMMRVQRGGQVFEVPLEREPLAVRQRDLRRRINQERDRRIAAAASFVCDDGTTFRPDLRSARDVQNITAIALDAKIARDLGQAGTVQFRAADDQTYELSLDEAIRLGREVKALNTAHYAAAWALKDGMPDTHEGLDSHDVTDDSHWPA